MNRQTVHRIVLVIGAILGLAFPCSTVAQDDELPACVVLPLEAGPQVGPGLPGVVAARLSDTLQEQGQVALVPREVIHTRLTKYGFVRANYETETEAATVAGLVVRADYVIIGNIDYSPRGYALSLSLVDVRTGQSIRRGTTDPVADPQDFVRRAPRSVIRFLIPAGESVVVLSPEPLPLPPRQTGQPAVPAPVVADPVIPPEPVAAVEEPLYQPAPVPKPVVEQVAPPLVDDAPDVSYVSQPSSESFADYVHNRLEIGTRVTYFRLMRADDDHFLGTIDHLAVEQDLWPIKLFALWKIVPDFGVELTWDHVSAEAQTPDDPDGTFSAYGPIVTGVLRFKTEYGWEPYGFAGFAWMFGEFSPHDWWGDGYPSPVEWEENGMTPTVKSRHMDVADSFGIVIGGGAAYAFNDRLALDLYLRYMSLELGDHYYIMQGDDVVDDRGVTKIPFDNVALGIGLKYVY